MASICSESFRKWARGQNSFSGAERISLEATVPTGLEELALAEAREKLSLTLEDCTSTQGHIYINLPIARYPAIKDLRSIDNVHLCVQYFSKLEYTGSQDVDIDMVKKLAQNNDLSTGVKTWAKLNEFGGKLKPTAEQHDAAKRIRDSCRLRPTGTASVDVAGAADTGAFACDVDVNVLKYRVTCTRALKHSFTSTQAEHAFGGILNDKYRWLVALDDFDLNLLLKIVGDHILVSLKLTQASLHNRCLVELGPTSLRPTIAYGMLRLCRIRPADLVLDPLCGGGSIPIEAAYGYPDSVVLCGDIHELAVLRSRQNVEAITTEGGHRRPDLFRWNSAHLPLPDGSVDVICTDLPFGKRINYDIRELYKVVLKEFFRVIKKESGRVCVLVHKAHNVIANLHNHFSVERKITVNVGGLRCRILLLRPCPSYAC